MLVFTHRFSRAATSLAGLALLGQSVLAQAPADRESLPNPGIPAPVAPAPSVNSPRRTDVPQIAQSPQSPLPPSFFESTEPLPLAPANAFGNPPAAPFTGPPQPSNATTAFGGYGGAFTPGQFGAGGGDSVTVADNVGYIDSAIIRSRVRVRYDSAYDMTTPDKGEFFYAKCGCFANPTNFAAQFAAGGIKAAAAAGYDPKARGPQHFPIVTGRRVDRFSGEPNMNFQEQSTYLEYASTRNFSTFIELPVRFLNPTLVKNYYGFSDINAGFKYAFVAEPDRYYTFQFRGYAPTGASDRGLGTGHVSLEPALLVFHRLSERIYFAGEFRDWIPVNASNFAGNILRYGVGLTYNMVLTDHFRIAPVNEVVGWTMLNGKEFVPQDDAPGYGVVRSVAGQTIVNEKIGIRIGLGDYSNPGGGSALNDRHSFYIGYGHALTGDDWYRDIVRAEYNMWF